MKTKPRTIYEWSAEMAYVVGLVASDGCLQRDGRVVLTSKDRELLETFSAIVGADVKIKSRSSGFGVTTSDVCINRPGFYEFLLAAGLTPAKSKTLGPLNVPPEYFMDLTRGIFDGDGSVVILKDARSRFPMLQVKFFSGSRVFLEWLWENLRVLAGVEGGTIYTFKRFPRQLFSLPFAKADSIRLLDTMYESENCPHLSCKRAKFAEFLELTARVVGQ